MNKTLTAIVAVLTGFSCFAQDGSIESMRQDLRSQIKQASNITKDCGQVAIKVAQNQGQLKQLAQQIAALRDNNHPSIQNALDELGKAYGVLNNAPSDCQNGLSHTSLLLEMYLEHIDTALMEYRFGVGSDLRRLRY